MRSIYMSSVNLTKLPSVTFVTQTTKDVENTLITTYEDLTGITLQPADPVRLFLESLAYVISIQNGVIELAGKQNLLAYAKGAHLDHLGALMGVSRIPAQSATCSIQFNIDYALNFVVPIPKGTRVATRDGSIVFATLVDTEIAIGETSVEVAAICTSTGSQATGLVEGQINVLVDTLPYITSVVNTTQTMEGADIEDDERLRERIRIAPESYTVAGSKEQYVARALEASAKIAAVSVYSPEPGVVDVRPVLDNGELPDAAIITMVEEALSAEDIRPLTDTVIVGAPELVYYDIEGTWYIHKANATLLSEITTAVNEAIEEYRMWQRCQPGRDIIPTKLIQLVQAAGAKRIELTSPIYTTLTQIEIARERNINLQFGGLEDE